MTGRMSLLIDAIACVCTIEMRMSRPSVDLFVLITMKRYYKRCIFHQKTQVM